MVYHRFLTDAERFLLAGHDPKYADHMPRMLRLNTTGNAYPPDMVAQMFLPIIAMISEKGSIGTKPTRMTDDGLRRIAASLEEVRPAKRPRST